VARLWIFDVVLHPLPDAGCSTNFACYVFSIFSLALSIFLHRRLSVYKQFKEGQKRILVATDLVGRGIDIERVNIVINYDMPETDDRHGNGADTYLHRVQPSPLAMPLCTAFAFHSPSISPGGPCAVGVGAIAPRGGGCYKACLFNISVVPIGACEIFLTLFVQQLGT